MPGLVCCTLRLLGLALGLAFGIALLSLLGRRCRCRLRLEFPLALRLLQRRRRRTAVARSPPPAPGGDCSTTSCARCRCCATSLCRSGVACDASVSHRASSRARVVGYDASYGRSLCRAMAAADSSRSACSCWVLRISASSSSRRVVRIRWTFLSFPWRVAGISSRSWSGSVMLRAAIWRTRVELPSSTHLPIAAMSPAAMACDRLASSSRARTEGSGGGGDSTRGRQRCGLPARSAAGGDLPNRREKSDIVSSCFGPARPVIANVTDAVPACDGRRTDPGSSSREIYR